MGCCDSCFHCLSLVPWASLIALVICWAGTALFCGAGHEAFSKSYYLLNSTDIPGFEWSLTYGDELIETLKYTIYGLAGFMFLLTIFLFVDGLMSTRSVKNDYDSTCKTSCCGLFSGIFLTFISYFVGIGWLVLTCGAVLPVYFFIVASSQCDAVTMMSPTPPTTSIDSVCIDFVQTGLIPPSTMYNSSYGRLCGSNLQMVCSSPQFDLTRQLYIMALVGAAAVVISMKQFLMCLSANFAYIKLNKKLAVYEDAKFREEMELNDIINTARSNERLTYKY